MKHSSFIQLIILTSFGTVTLTAGKVSRGDDSVQNELLRGKYTESKKNHGKVNHGSSSVDTIVETIPDISDEDIAKVMDWIKAEVTMVYNPFCWRDTYGRGVGTIPGRVADCPSGYTNNGLTCGRGAHTIGAPSRLADCPSGYVNHGLTCHRPAKAYWKGCTTIFKKYGCRSGYTDMGCHCWKGPHNVSASKMVCPSGYFKSSITARCHKKCPSGYTNTGETCFRGVSTLGLSSMSCRKDERAKVGGARCYPKHGNCYNNGEEDAGLCYKKCKSYFDGVGPVCWSKCDNSQVNCGLACAKSTSDCVLATADQVIAPLVVAANILSFGLTTPATAGGVATIKVGGKTVTSASKSGKALIYVVNKLQNIKADGLNKGASITQRIVHARTGTQLSKTMTTAKLNKIAYNAARDYRRAYADDFKTMTSTGIEKELDSHFHSTTARYLKEYWANIQLKEMAEANHWNIASSVLSAASIVDITGVTGVVAAYAKPICNKIVAFPCISADTSSMCGNAATCKDNNTASCPGWAKKGYCVKTYVQWMSKNCKKSCGKCG